MKKTIISLLLALCMVVCLTAFTASAEETATAEAHPHDDANYAHCVCGGSAVGVHDHECTDIEWSPLPEGTTDFGTLDTGNYYLTGDVAVSDDTAITAGKDIKLCLNGYNITSTNSRVFGSPKQAYLSICDCSGVQDAEGNWTWGGTVTAGESSSTYGGVLYTHFKSEVNIYGGNFTGLSTSAKRGSVFLIANDGCPDMNGDGSVTDTDKGYAENAATFNLWNGNIYGSVTTSQSGGIIGSFHNVIMNIHGGTVSGGKATQNGGNIACTGTLTITGGKIYGGKNTSSSYNGGNIYVSTGSLTISGGEIYDGNSAARGGNIYSTVPVTVTGGKIYNGTAAHNGGNIFCSKQTSIEGGEIYGGKTTASDRNGGNIYVAGGSLTISDGKIYGGTATNRGGNIFTYADAESGTYVPLTITGGEIYNGTAGNNGGNVYSSYTLDIQGGEIYGGHAKLNGGNIASTNKTTISGGKIYNGIASGNPTLTDNGDGTYTWSSTEGNWTRGLGGNIFGSGSNNSITISGGQIYDGQAYGVFGGNIHSHVGPLTISGGEIWGGVANADDDEQFRGLGSDDYWRVCGGSVCIRQGIFTMTGGTIGIDAEGNPAGGTCLPAGEGGNLYMTGRTSSKYQSKISGGTIAYGNVTGLDSSGNKVYGPVIKGGNISGSSFTEITGNAVIRDGYATSEGGNITLYGLTGFTMTGGTVSGGRAASYGGNIVMNGGSGNTMSVTISGGTIKDGVAESKNGGNIAARRSTQTLNIQGTAKIQGGQSNFAGGNIYAYCTLNIQDDVEISGGKSTGSSAGNIYYENSNVLTISGNVKISDGTSAKEGGNIAAYGPVDIQGNVQISGGNSKTTGGNIHITSNKTLTISGSVKISSGTAAGYGGNIYAPSGTTVTITDATIEKGTSTGSGAGNLYSVGTVTLTNLIFEGGSSASAGGSIRMNAGSNLTMTGCTFDGGHSGSLGGNVYINDEATITDCIFKNGTASTGGGNITFASGAVVSMSGCTFEKGSTDVNGGSMYISATTQTTITDCTFDGGTALEKGGNVYLQSGTKLTFTDCEMKNGVAANESGTVTYGGNLYSEATTLTIEGGTYSGGTASHGGCVCMAAGTNKLESTAISDGTANLVENSVHAGLGGNIYIAEGATSDITTCTITGGKAVYRGGSIYNAGTLNLTGGSVKDGTADHEKPVKDDSGAIISGSKATTGGGNIYSDGTVNIDGAIITGGSASLGGNIYLGAGTNEIKKATISNGKANLMSDGTTNGNGGNVLSGSGATTTITGCTITGGEARRAGSVGVWGKVTIEDTTITGGYAYYDGGNIMTYGNGRMTLNDGTVLSEGVAGDSGGAIAMHSNTGKISTVNSGVVINDGTAGVKNACGIYVSGGTLTLNGTPSITSIKVNNSGTSFGMTVTDYTGAVINLYGNAVGAFAASETDKTAYFANNQGYVIAYRGGYMYLDAPADVYVSNAGSDSNPGTQTAPYLTMAHAMTMVADKGTINLLDAVELTTWDKHEKGFTVTGGELVLPETRVYVNDHVTFDNLTITMPLCTTTTSSNLGSYFFYCNGFTTVFEEDVTIRYLYNGTYMTDPYHEVTYTKSDGTTVTTDACSILYGGAPSNGIEGTNLTVLSGIWGRIYGGCNGKDMTGDVHLTVGGKVNEGVDYATIGHDPDTASFYRILGGSRSGNITGTVYMNVTGGTHVSTHGGSEGACSVTAVELTVTGGTGMALYGAGRGGAQTIENVNFYYEGGTFEQVFGGALSKAMTGNVNLYVTGGKITRRVYGGCYNETSGLSFSTSHQVTGNVTLYIGGGAQITRELTEHNDRSIYGHSRYKATSTDAENSAIIFLDETAYTTYKDNLKYEDYAMGIFMSGVSAADNLHYFTYTASGDTLTRACAYDSSESATAKLVLDSEVELIYRGEAVEPVNVVYTDWAQLPVEIVYANNDKAGTATASITAGGQTATLSFELADGALAQIGTKEYYSVQAAADAVTDDQYVKLIGSSDEAVTVSKDLYLDLNGFSLTGTVTVADGCTLYGMDSSTNDYDCSDGYGEIKSVEGTVALHHKTDVTGRILRYLTYTEPETGVVSFHRIYLGITHMSLRPGVVGVGYKAKFFGDQLAQSMLNETEAFGYKLWLKKDGSLIGSTDALYKPASEFENGKDVTLRLQNFDVANYGEAEVYAEVYLKLNDEAGTVIDSSDYVMTLRGMMEAIDKAIEADPTAYDATQMAALQAMCQSQIALGAMSQWAITNSTGWTAPTA